MKKLSLLLLLVFISASLLAQIYTPNGLIQGPTLNPPNNNVGLGTNNPSIWFSGKVLEIYDTRPVLKLNSNNFGNAVGRNTIMFTSSSIPTSGHVGEFFINYEFYNNLSTYLTSILSFSSYNDIRMPHDNILTLNLQGNIGIGTTSPTDWIVEPLYYVNYGIGRVVEIYDKKPILKLNSSATDVDGISTIHFTNQASTSQTDYRGEFFMNYKYNLNTPDNSYLMFNTYNTASVNQNTHADILALIANGNIGIGTSNPNQKLEIYNGNLLISNNNSNAGEIRLAESSAYGSNYTAFKSQAQNTDLIYTLPAAYGTNGQVLTTNNSGLLSWTSANSSITAVGSMTYGNVFSDNTADDDWLGLGASNGRIEFDDQTVDEVNILDANVGIGTPDPYLWFSGRVLEIYNERPVLKLNSSSTGNNGYSTITFTNTAITNQNHHHGEFHLNYKYNTTPDNSSIMFQTYNSTAISNNTHDDILALITNGNVGIGTSNPHVNGSYMTGRVIEMYNERPILKLTSNTTGANGLSTILFSNTNISSNIGEMFIEYKYNSTTPNESKIKYNSYTNPSSSGPIFSLASNGKVSVGQEPTTGSGHSDYLFAVSGKIVAQEIIVISNNSSNWQWPDYVFGKDYKLRSYNELENFVKLNKHLPDVPSEQDIVTNGMNVVEINKSLLKKVEEMTLYIIELNKRIETLEKVQNK